MARAVFVGSIRERTAAQEHVASRAEFHSRILQSVKAVATPSASAKFIASVTESAQASDAITRRLLWEIINDFEIADWTTINTSESTTWSTINTSDAGGWQVIKTQP